MNVADLWKFTPLHEAAAKGKFEICRLLLKVGLMLAFHILLCVYFLSILLSLNAADKLAQDKCTIATWKYH